jgi:hypothetical protein
MKELGLPQRPRFLPLLAELPDRIEATLAELD